ncbi:cell surface protein [Halorussus limi]|jgi:metal-responsive CopG/Arc/MetJ family transcriptional regulator|uniref:Cell surface protein n=1 Tax=Halorussus limi TaxID=2938695 RepID=A0A8U0HVU1_9EURY|nr:MULTISPECIES: cell surface protein [Halorussus]UPV75038.1 cell surface protein [Halorussus limi]
MPQLEISLSDDVDMQIDQLVTQEEFVDRQEALEEILSLGIKEYQTTMESDTRDEMEFADEMMETTERSLGDEDEGYRF